MKNQPTLIKLFLSCSILFLHIPAWSQFFEPRVIYHGHGLIYGSEILDVNGDGLDDIIMTRDRLLPNGTAGISLYVYEAFQDNNEISYSATITPLTNQNQLFKIDYDRDGDIDLMTQRTPNIYTVSHALLENKEGKFNTYIPLPDLLKDSMTNVRLTRDLDQDGFEEVIYTNAGLWKASFPENGEVIIRSILPTLHPLDIMDVMDFNGDGFLDLVVVDTEDDELLVLVSQNNLTYLSVVAETGFNHVKKYIGASDYAGQGYLELLFFNNTTKEVIAIRPELTGGDPTTRMILDTLDGSSVFYSEDFNADGFEDFYVDGLMSNTLYLNDQNGNFTTAPSFLNQTLSGQIFYLTHDLSANKTTIYFNAETIEKYTYDNGDYNLTQIPIPDLDVRGLIPDIQIVDVDDDGIRDLAMAVYSDVGGISYLKGLPQKQFGDMHLILGDEIDISEFTLVDLNGDDIDDLVYGDQDPGIVKVKYGEGYGRFCCSEEIIPGPGLTGGLIVTDFESDGFPDILVSSRSTSEVLVVLNHNGTFETPFPIFNEECFVFCVRDIDFDGDPDVFVQNPDTGFVLIHNPGLVFTPTDIGITYARDDNFHDFDKDGQDEFVNFGSNEIVILKYNGIRYEEWINLGNTGTAFLSSHVVTDYNRDGFLDFIIGRYNSPAQLLLNDQNQAFIDDGLFVEKFGFHIPFDGFSSEFSGHDLDADGDTDIFYTWKNNIFRISQIHGHQSIAGINYWDFNMNASQDSTENGIPDMKISATDQHGYRTSTFGDDEGMYVLPLDTGSYTLHIESFSGCWETIEQNPRDIYITESHTDTLRTPFFIEGHEHHVTSVQTSGVPRCHQDVVFNFILTNDGCQTLHGEVTLFIHDLIAQFEPLLSIPFEVAGRRITFRADTLIPGESRVYKVRFTMPGPDFLHLTMKHRLEYAYELADGTLEGLEHANDFTSVLRCSFDPNDKLVSPDRSGELGETYVTGEDLLYTIRFQNTGNDTAFTIRLEDEISPLLDLSTFRAADASHPYRIELVEETRKLTVYFDDILLPDSTTNRTASEGYFSFLIRPVGSLSDFTSIHNTAEIYFDFNSPIVTNTTEVIFISDLSILNTATLDPDSKEGLLYPNPSTGKIYSRSSQITNIEVFDLLGRKVSFEFDGTGIELTGVHDGVYLVVWSDGMRPYREKIVVRK